LSFPYVHYLTNDETTPWKFISKNRIYNLDILIQEEEEDDDEEEPNEE
jgi:hypothetical protein